MLWRVPLSSLFGVAVKPRLRSLLTSDIKAQSPLYHFKVAAGRVSTICAV